MTVYFAFIQCATTGKALPVRMEEAPNLAVPQRCLQKRARLGSSRTFYHGVQRGASVVDQPEEHFPEADMSAMMLVWRRRAEMPRPGMADQPDEVWSLTGQGAVVREPWQHGVMNEDRITPPPFEQPSVYRRARPEPLMQTLPTERRMWMEGDEEVDFLVIREIARAPRKACSACDVVPDLRGFCGCS